MGSLMCRADEIVHLITRKCNVGCTMLKSTCAILGGRLAATKLSWHIVWHRIARKCSSLRAALAYKWAKATSVQTFCPVQSRIITTIVCKAQLKGTPEHCCAQLPPRRRLLRPVVLGTARHLQTGRKQQQIDNTKKLIVKPIPLLCPVVLETARHLQTEKKQKHYKINVKRIPLLRPVVLRTGAKGGVLLRLLDLELLVPLLQVLCRHPRVKLFCKVTHRVSCRLQDCPVDVEQRSHSLLQLLSACSGMWSSGHAAASHPDT